MRLPVGKAFGTLRKKGDLLRKKTAESLTGSRGSIHSNRSMGV